MDRRYLGCINRCEFSRAAANDREEFQFFSVRKGNKGEMEINIYKKKVPRVIREPINEQSPSGPVPVDVDVTFVCKSFG